jgi:hypothetical protein
MLLERKEIVENNEIGYIESIFKSENILKTTYFPQNQRLYVAFSRGHTYSYANITPEMYVEFENCDSQGKYFHKYINNKPNHQQRREFTLYPNEVQGIKENIDDCIRIAEENQFDGQLNNGNED